MTPPETPPSDAESEGCVTGAVLSCPPLTVLTQRRDFQRAARGKRVAKPGFVLQVLQRPAADDHGVRIGYTCSKKVGNAVARNRAKRRLREVARAVLPAKGVSGHDYVLIGRQGATATLPFSQLVSEMEHALAILHVTPR